MEKPRQHSKSSILLFEIMINICFFSLLLCVCLQFFIKAHQISRETTELNHAVTCVTSAAENYRGFQGDSSAMITCFPNAEYTGAVLTVYYNEDFKECASDESVYKLTASFTDGSILRTADISFSSAEDGTVIYGTTVSIHIPYRADDEPPEDLNSDSITDTGTATDTEMTIISEDDLT